MYTSITIKKNETELGYEEYRFILMDSKLYLDTYVKMTRESKRHKFTTEKAYDRVGGRNYLSGTIKDPKDVPLTEEIKAEAKEQLFDKIVVSLWDK